MAAAAAGHGHLAARFERPLLAAARLGCSAAGQARQLGDSGLRTLLCLAVKQALEAQLQALGRASCGPRAKRVAARAVRRRFVLTGVQPCSIHLRGMQANKSVEHL